MNRQSLMCRACWQGEHARPENYAERICLKCGAAFRVHKIHVERGQAKYCSRSCARSGSPTRKKSSPIVECRACGMRFNKFRAEIRKNRGRNHYCSPECWYSFNQRDNHYLWEGGQNERMNPDASAWRKAVLKRDGTHCRLCHVTKKLEAHHIRPFSTHPEVRWNVANGITLCHSCHVRFRHREMEHAEALSIIAAIPVVVWK